MPLRGRPEPLSIALALALVGGILDGYTYLERNHVLAGAQTGNVVLLALDAGQGLWADALSHVPSLLAFLTGVAFVEVAGRPLLRRLTRRPVRAVVLIQASACLAAGFVPAAPPNTTASTVATILTAFAASLQFATFRNVRGLPYTPVMTMGNMRSVVELSHAALSDRDPTRARQAMVLATVVVAFAVGAGLAGPAGAMLEARAIWLAVPALLLIVVALALHTRRAEAAVPTGG